MSTKKKTQKKLFETSYELLDQRDWFDTEFMEKHEEKYSCAIGSFLILDFFRNLKIGLAK